MKASRLLRSRRVVRLPGALGVLGTGLAAAGGWILYSNVGINHEQTLTDAISAERSTFSNPTTGEVSYYADRSAEGRPLVLIHSVNAAASAYEMKPLFENYRGSRQVFAIDLPGFGFSQRSDRRYLPQLFESAIYTLLKEAVGQSADVVALSLGAEFAALAALYHPDLFHSLTLISPSGFSNESQAEEAEKMERMKSQESTYNMLSIPLWSRPLYDLIATRPSIRYFLGKSFVGPVPDEMVDYAYVTAHQPGGKYAPLHFLSGRLFTPNIRQDVYAKLGMPILVIYDRDPFVSFDQLPEHLEQHPNWRAQRITPTLGLPHFDTPDETAQALDGFWASLG